MKPYEEMDEVERLCYMNGLDEQKTEDLQKAFTLLTKAFQALGDAAQRAFDTIAQMVREISAQANMSMQEVRNFLEEAWEYFEPTPFYYHQKTKNYKGRESPHVKYNISLWHRPRAYLK